MSLILIMADVCTNILCKPVLKKPYEFCTKFLASILVIAGFTFQRSLESETDKYILSRETNQKH